jgi:hypothetical protein
MSDMQNRAAEEGREVTRGRAWHTPFMALGGVAAVVWAVAAIVIAIALILWLALR